VFKRNGHGEGATPNRGLTKNISKGAFQYAEHSGIITIRQFVFFV